MKFFRILIAALLVIPDFLSADDLRIIPAVQIVENSGDMLTLSAGIKISYRGELKNEAEMLIDYLKDDFDISASLSKKNPDIVLKLEKSNKCFKEDAYNIQVKDKIEITSESATGIFYGIQTLRQMISKNGNDIILSKVNINDYPAYKWRAFMLDESRAFKGMKIVKGLLDEMARLKMNVFHWHLTDDQGWRIEIKKYPDLINIGSWRDSTQIGGYRGKTFDGKRHGGYYTQNEIKEIVEYANKRHILVVPEFEMPGHESAAIAAYPWLGTTKKQIKVPCRFGVQYEVMDVSSPEVHEFINDVLDEIIEIFPSPIVHIGGDEVKYDQWKASENIQKYMKENSIKTPADLQIAFTNEVSYLLKKKGRRMMGWNDITGSKIHEYNSVEDTKSTSKLADGTIVQFWKGDTSLIEETAKGGYDIVNSYHYMTYLDYDYSKIPLEKAYSFNPMPEYFPESLKSKVLGLGCQMWGEEIMSTDHMFEMIFPRIAAYAEVGWTLEQNKNFDSFKETLPNLIRIWQEKGYTVHK